MQENQEIPMKTNSNESYRIKVHVQKVIYRTESFAVLKCTYSTRPDQEIVVVGSFDDIRPGLFLEVVGNFSVHKRFGQQLSVKSYSKILPEEADGIEKYLSKGFVRGIGKGYAKKLFEYFGKDVLKIIDQHPERLSEVPGIGKKRQEAIINSWEKERRKELAKRETLIALLGLGFSQMVSQKIWEMYREEGLAIARRNPYSFISHIHRFGFQTADKIALKNGLPPDSKKRIAAGLFYTLKTAENDGHCYLPKDILAEYCSTILDVSIDRITGEIDLLIKNNQIIEGPDHSIYSIAMYSYEKEAANRLNALLAYPIDFKINSKTIESSIASNIPIQYTDEQLRAIRGVFENPVSIITGGPGTGKTTTLRAIIDIGRRLNFNIMVAAPTGRAAKRASESAGMNAITIHRMLHYEPYKGKFMNDSDNPLSADMIIVDEVSMVDAQLFYSLIIAVSQGTLLVLVGDIDQLESVGPGAVLRQLVSYDNISLFRLTKIIRQKEESMIIQATHSILEGIPPIFDNRKDGDFFFIAEENPLRCVNTIVDLVSKRLPDYYKIDPVDIQVITPMHKGELGTTNLNKKLRHAINPSGKVDESSTIELTTGNIEFRLGDRVMQTENNYDIDVYNGDWGIVKKISEDGMVVSFDRDILYPTSALYQLVLAYAVTVHKSQGSEYPAVVMPLSTAHFIMLDRNLIYTAFSRAKRLLIVVGSPKALEMAVSNLKKTERYTNLGYFLNSGK